MAINRIDLEEITDRVDELRDDRDAYNEKMDDPEAWARIGDGEPQELAELEELLEELRGAGGGDYQWEGDWYPRELIDVDDFEEYTEELVSDAYDIPDTWPHRCIDWKRAAEELAQDYSMVSLRDSDYYWR